MCLLIMPLFPINVTKTWYHLSILWTFIVTYGSLQPSDGSMSSLPNEILLIPVHSDLDWPGNSEHINIVHMYYYNFQLQEDLWPYLDSFYCHTLGKHCPTGVWCVVFRHHLCIQRFKNYRRVHTKLITWHQKVAGLRMKMSEIRPESVLIHR
jgi:hypothetical protein